MFLRARPTAMTLLLGGTLLASAAQAAPWDSWFSKDTEQSTQLGPKRVPAQNAGDRTPAEALDFSGAQPHAAGASGFDMPQPQVQGMIDQPDFTGAPAGTQAPSTPIFADSSPAMSPSPMPVPQSSTFSSMPPVEEPSYGDRFLSWAGLAPETKASPELGDVRVSDHAAVVPNATPGMMPAAAVQPAASIEYYDADGYPILSATPESPMRPDLTAKTAEANALSNTNQAAEATRQRFMDHGENAFAPAPGQSAYQPAPLDAPLPTGSYSGNMSASQSSGPMDELAFGAEAAQPAAHAIPALPPTSGRQAVNALDAAQYANAPEPLRPTRLSDAPLEAPPMLSSTLPASIDLMAPDSAVPQPTPQMAMTPTREAAPQYDAPQYNTPQYNAPLQAYAPAPQSVPLQAAPAWSAAEPAAPASRNDTAQSAAESFAAAPQEQNRAVPTRAPANLAPSNLALGDQPMAQPIPASNAPIPLPPAIAAYSSDYGESSAAGQVPVSAPGTPGANRVAPLRYLPESRYAERRGVKTADPQ